jgi:hypothetical protein
MRLQVVALLNLRSAFCIIQDDLIDKAREISQMPWIYSGATVTIVASRASGVHEGVLQDRSIAAGELGSRFSLPFKCHDGVMGNFILHDKEPYQLSESEPLDKRAWASQERLLSPRTIEYGTLQTKLISEKLESDWR